MKVRWLLTILWVLIASAVVGLFILASANDAAGVTGSASTFAMLGLVYGIFGTLIVLRARNTIGWLFLAIALALPLGSFTEQWAAYGVKTCPGCLPIVPAFIVVQMLIWNISTASIALTFLLFPSGRLPAWHGRGIFRTFLASMAVVSLTLMLRPADPGAPVENPFGIVALRVPILFIFGIATVLALGSAAAAIVGLFVRFRRSQGVERQQMKWLVAVGIASTLAFVLGVIPTFFAKNPGDLGWLVFFNVLVFGIPISVGLAILRYKLYDIDRIISRTVGYSIVTAILVSAYIGAVVLLQSIFVGANNDLIVATSTLTVAAAFGPVRRRIQERVDHRFNRRKYDAERIIESFNLRLREQLDIDVLGAELRATVAQSLQPSRVDLWIK